jgi:hypothetical protein
MRKMLTLAIQHVTYIYIREQISDHIFRSSCGIAANACGVSTEKRTYARGGGKKRDRSEGKGDERTEAFS